MNFEINYEVGDLVQMKESYVQSYLKESREYLRSKLMIVLEIGGAKNEEDRSCTLVYDQGSMENQYWHSGGLEKV